MNLKYLKPNSLLRAAAWLAAGACGFGAAQAVAGTLELRSIMIDSQGARFSIHDTAANTAYWLSSGEARRDLRVLDYDDISHEVIVQHGNETVRLKLSGASILDSGTDTFGSAAGANGLTENVNPLNPRLGVTLASTAISPAVAAENTSKTRDLSGLPVHQLPAFKRRQLTEPATNTSTGKTPDPTQINRGLNPRLWNQSS